jgi:uncharacterized protein (TIGR02996 family)
MHDTFLAAIRREFENPQPLLAYADWLEGQGDLRALLYRTLTTEGRCWSFGPPVDWRASPFEAFISHVIPTTDLHQLWVRTLEGVCLWTEVPVLVAEEYTLWVAEQALERERQRGIELPAYMNELLETKRRWLRGEATILELGEANGRAERAPVEFGVGLAVRCATSSDYPFAQVIQSSSYLHMGRGPIAAGSCPYPFELALRLCSQCEWQRGESPPERKFREQRMANGVLLREEIPETAPTQPVDLSAVPIPGEFTIPTESRSATRSTRPRIRSGVLVFGLLLIGVLGLWLLAAH